MNVIFSPRRSGKTTRLILECAKNDGTMVVIDKSHAAAVAERARELGIDNFNYPITHSEFIKHSSLGKRINAYYIDEAQILLQEIAKYIPVKAISINDDRLEYKQETNINISKVDKTALDKEVKSIENAGIREFCKYILEEVPENFWSDPASFSGKYHKGETRVQHVKEAFAIATELTRLYALNPIDSDCVKVAILLHDCYTHKCEDGHVNSDHAEAMAKFIFKLYEDFDCIADCISKPILGKIAEAVRDHMSWWGQRQFDWTSSSVPNITKIVILADYMSSRNNIKVDL